MSPKSRNRRLLLCTIPNRGPIEGFLWQRADERVAALKEVGEEALVDWVGLLAMGMTALPQLVAQVQAEYRTVKAILEEERARFEG